METTIRSGLAGQAQPAQESLQSSVRDLDPVIERIEKVAHRLCLSADHIVGQRPESAAPADKSPEPNHLIWALQARRARLVAVADYLETHISRLEVGIAA
jgi:hypothetical protein